MASERILELLRRPVDADEYTEIRELWKTHSIAEDNRDLPGLISTLKNGSGADRQTCAAVTLSGLVTSRRTLLATWA